MSNLSAEKLQQLYDDFPAQFKSVVLGTVSADGQPQASYAPCVMDSDRNIYIFVSGLSAHTQNLEASGKTSVLFVQDEAQTTQMFARKRLSYQCEASLLPRDSEDWGAIAQKFEARFGNIVELMVGLPDFRLFQLRPKSGRFVVGFGAAYDINPNDLSRLIHKGAS